MPSGWLSVPAHKQSRAGRCLPACAKMVLAYFGDERSEEDLAKLLKTRAFGTLASNIRFLEASGYAVVYGQTSLLRLREYLDSQIPPIIFLQTDALPNWRESVNHAVVLLALTTDQAVVADPAFDSVQTIPLEAFLLAWSDFDYRFAVMSKMIPDR